MYILQIIVPIFLGLCSSVLVAQAHQFSDQTEKVAPSSLWNVTLGGYSGIGQYPDLQVPIDLLSGQRADGKRVEKDSSSHSGLLLGVQLGTRYHWREAFMAFHVDAMQIMALSGSPDTASSSYKRLDGTTSIGTRFSMFGWQHQPFVSVGYRRSMFQNVSNGHYLSTFLVGGGDEIHVNSFLSLYLDGAVGIVPSFYYSDGYSVNGEALKSVSNSIMTFRSGFSYAVSKKSTINVGLQMEQIQVHMSDISEYNSAGLFFENPLESTSYTLDTSAVTFGFTTVM